MGLLSIFKRSGAPAASVEPARDAGGAVQQARTRARQRLIGAVVLVAIGVIGFPLVFETQPRPIPVDIPIELPRKENPPPLTMPPARVSSSELVVAPRASEPLVAAPADVITESREEAGRALPVAVASAPPAPAIPKPTTLAQASVKQPAAAASVAAASVPPTPVTTWSTTSPANDAGRAQALLEGQGAKTAVDARYVVQVGAFLEASAAREARLKVEKLGMRTYTQVTDSATGKRIRVRVGPFVTRAEADKALGKARAAGLTGIVLTL